MFMTVKVPRGSLDDEAEMVCARLSTHSTRAYLPNIFLRFGLETIRRIEARLHVVCEPFVGIDFALEAIESANLGLRPVAGLEDAASAVAPALIKNAASADPREIEISARRDAPNSAAFVQREIPGCDFPALIKKLHDVCGGGPVSAEKIRKALRSASDLCELEMLSRWAVEHETIQQFRIHEVIAEYIEAYRSGIAEQIQARGGRPGL